MFENYFSPKTYVALSNSVLLLDVYKHFAIVIKQIIIRGVARVFIMMNPTKIKWRIKRYLT